MKHKDDFFNSTNNSKLIENPTTVDNFDNNLKIILKENLTYIYENIDMTYETLSNQISTSKTSVYKYMKGESLPSLPFLCSLCNLLNLDLKDLLSENLASKNMVETTNNVSKTHDNEHRRFLGTFDLYYFKTDYAIVEDFTSHEDFTFGFDYGIMHIYNSNTFSPNNDINDYRVIATFSLSLKEMKDIKHLIKSNNSLSKIKNVIKTHNRDLEKPRDLYTGDISISSQHIYINLTNINTKEKVQLTFHLPPASGLYKGGLGIVSSISKGRIKDPCIQNIALSRYHLKKIGNSVTKKLPSKEDQKLSKFLKLNNEYIEIAPSEKDEIIQEIVEMTTNEEFNNSDINKNTSIKMKRFFIKSLVGDLIDKYKHINTLSLSKISNEEDHKFYREMLQHSSDEEIDEEEEVNAEY